jgi:hypothetical protein
MMDKHEQTSATAEASALAPALSAQDAEAYRAALQRVVDSESFAGSRRMSAFLLFAGQAALEGRTEIDQYEIAEQVLHRHEDFNPLDDASVRKLASQVRSKLEEYFEGEGAAEPVVISLPRRSYIPRFRYRVLEAAAPVSDASADAPAVEVDAAPRAEFGWWWAAGAAALLAGGIWLGTLVAPKPLETVEGEAGTIVIRTERGDLRGEPLDVAPDGALLGPELASGEEATVALNFVPESATQQAGVMALATPDHFVRFGQHFKDRAMLEQSYEVDARPNQRNSHFLADAMGQFGRPRWLSLRRAGSSYEAFLSPDSFAWTSFAPPMEVAGLPEAQRAAIYAYNGRTEGPSATARFSDFRVGPAFHSRPDGPFGAEEFPGWREDGNCAEATDARLEGGVLQVGFAPTVVGCTWYFTRPAPEGDWSFATLVDFMPVSGSVAGMVVRGTGSGTAHLSRRHYHTTNLILERTHDEDQRITDFPGTPPVILRLELKGDTLYASASRDGRKYLPIGDGLRLTGKREDLRIGVYTMIAHWTSEAPRPPARFHWVQRLVEAPETLERAGFR